MISYTQIDCNLQFRLLKFEALVAKTLSRLFIPIKNMCSGYDKSNAVME